MLRAFDVGYSVDLERLRSLPLSWVEGPRSAGDGRLPRDFNYQGTAFRHTSETAVMQFGRFSTDAEIDVHVHDFGALLIVLRIPLQQVSLHDLAELSDKIYDSTDLDKRCRLLVAEVMAKIQYAITNPEVSSTAEDYTVFELEELDAVTRWEALVEEHASTLGKIIKGEAIELSNQEVREALRFQNSYTPKDGVIVGWDAAIVYGPEDVALRAVLGLLTIELVELRFLDSRLDYFLDRAHQLVVGRFEFRGILGDSKAMQVESALLFEAVQNAAKLVSDHYLARVYRQGARRFHFAKWYEAIERKLDVVEDIYEKKVDERKHYLGVILEVTVILLILFEVIHALL